MLINGICHTKSESDFFCIPETFWICVVVLWIHKGYFVAKKLVWNVYTKAFWYTNLINKIFILHNFSKNYNNEKRDEFILYFLYNSK